MDFLLFLIYPVAAAIVMMLFFMGICLFAISMSAFYVVLEWEHWIPIVLGIVVGVVGFTVFIFTVSLAFQVTQTLLNAIGG